MTDVTSGSLATELFPETSSLTQTTPDLWDKWNLEKYILAREFLYICIELRPSANKPIVLFLFQVGVGESRYTFHPIDIVGTHHTRVLLYKN